MKPLNSNACFLGLISQNLTFPVGPIIASIGCASMLIARNRPSFAIKEAAIPVENKFTCFVPQSGSVASLTYLKKGPSGRRSFTIEPVRSKNSCTS